MAAERPSWAERFGPMVIRGLKHRFNIATEEAAALARFLLVDIQRPPGAVEEMEKQGLMLNYDPPKEMILMALGDFLYDEQGNRYADFQGAYSANNAGNCNPRITGTNFLAGAMTSVLSRARRSRQLALAAEELQQALCDPESGQPLTHKIMPMNSGCEAIEGAVLLAKLAFNRHPRFQWRRDRLDKGEIDPKLVVCRNNFHGRSSWAKAASSNPAYREPFAPNTMESEIRWVEFGDAEGLERVFSRGDVYAFCVEPIQCEGGMNCPPEGYFREVRRLCDEYDVMLVMDEVQTGLGRTGRMLGQMHYFDNGAVEADFISLAKSLSGGQEVASAVLAKPEYADLVRPSEHGSTFGGNPKAAATVRAALRELHNRQLCEKALKNGQFCLEQLQDICELLPWVLDVRGVGLAIGIEIKGHGADDICELLRHTPFVYRGRQVSGCWTNSTHGVTDETTVIRVSPPLTMPKDLIAASMYAFAKALGHLEADLFRSPGAERPKSLSELMMDIGAEAGYYGQRLGQFTADLINTRRQQRR